MIQTWKIMPLEAAHREPAIETFYHGLYNQGDPLPERSILERQNIQPYFADFPSQEDVGFVAFHGPTSRFAGVVYCRFFSPDICGVGFYQEGIPELSIAVMPEFRGQGCGTGLLSMVLKETDGRSLDVSLNCNSKNPAKRLYERFGFSTIRSRPIGDLMVRRTAQQVSEPGTGGTGE